MSHLSKGGPFVKGWSICQKGWSICQKVRSICQKVIPIVFFLRDICQKVSQNPHLPILLANNAGSVGPVDIELSKLDFVYPTYRMEKAYVDQVRLPKQLYFHTWCPR